MRPQYRFITREWRHQLPRIRQRLQSPECRQQPVQTCIGQRLHRIMRAVAELDLELSIGERLLRRPDRIAGLDRNRAPIGPLNRDAERSSRSAFLRDAGDAIRQRQDRGIPQTVDLRYPYLAMHQGGGDEEGLGELRLHHLGGTALCRPAAELVAVSGGVRLDRHRLDVIGPLDFEPGSCRERSIDRGVQWATAGVGLVAQRLAVEGRAQVAQQHRCVVSVWLVKIEEPETAIEDCCAHR